MKELSSKKFRAWLEARSPHGSVGEARREWSCPLATYLGPGWRVRYTGARYVEPGRFTAERGPKVVAVPLPLWAKRFVRAVDRLPNGLSGYRKVWPQTALRLLDDVEAGLASPSRRRRGEAQDG